MSSRGSLAGDDDPALEVYLSVLSWAAHRRNPAPERRDELLRHGLPLIPQLRAKRIDSLLYLACARDDPAQRVYDKVWTIQRRAAHALLRELDASGVYTVVMKGAEIVERFFGGHGLTFLNDVDLLVARDDIQAIKRILYANGYAQHLFNRDRQALLPRDVREIAEIEAAHYELAPFNRLEEIELDDDEAAFVRAWDWHPVWAVGQRFFVVAEFDVHYAVAFDVPGEEFFPRCVPSALGAGRSMSLADQLWFVTSRFYNEVGASGKATLRDIAYLTAVLAGGGIDWDVVVDAAERYDLRPSLYYYFCFADWLAGGGVLPSWVVQRLRPSLGARGRDWGWQLAKLIGSDETFSPAVAGTFAPAQDAGDHDKAG